MSVDQRQISPSTHRRILTVRGRASNLWDNCISVDKAIIESNVEKILARKESHRNIAIAGDGEKLDKVEKSGKGESRTLIKNEVPVVTKKETEDKVDAPTPTNEPTETEEPKRPDASTPAEASVFLTWPGQVPLPIPDNIKKTSKFCFSDPKSTAVSEKTKRPNTPLCPLGPLGSEHSFGSDNRSFYRRTFRVRGQGPWEAAMRDLGSADTLMNRYGYVLPKNRK